MEEKKKEERNRKWGVKWKNGERNGKMRSEMEKMSAEKMG
jgi:hypothetical protein